MCSAKLLGGTVDGEQIPPYRALKGTHKENDGMFLIFHMGNRVLKLRFSAFSRGPGGFRELREAGRKHFTYPDTYQCSWSLVVGAFFLTVYGTS